MSFRVSDIEKIINEKDFLEKEILKWEFLLEHNEKLKYWENLKIKMNKFINQKYN
jgi:hypothetical protein